MKKQEHLKQQFSTSNAPETLQAWKKGLVERLNFLTDMFTHNNMPGSISIETLHFEPTKQEATLTLQVTLEDSTPQSFCFMIGSYGNTDNYHVFCPDGFVVYHEKIPGSLSGYSLKHSDSGYFENFIADILDNTIHNQKPHWERNTQPLLPKRNVLN